MPDTTKETSPDPQPAARPDDRTWVKPRFVVVPISASELNAGIGPTDGATSS
jgi:hypothetical protein